MTGGVSRRELLAGIGMAGAAIGSSAVGHSTASAFLSDAERFAGNVTTSGEVDLAVDYESHYEGADGTTSSGSGTVDGDSVDGLDVPELAPGDSGRFVFCPTIVGNPAYLWLCGAVTRNAENGTPDPEGETVNGEDAMPVDGPGGELATAMTAELAYVPSFDDSSERTVIHKGSFEEVMGFLRHGVPLSSDGIVAGPGSQACFEGSGQVCVELTWGVPDDGNLNNISTDELEFEFEFTAQQCRHNDGTENPCPQGISFVSFCVDGSTSLSDSDVTFSVAERNAAGEPVAIEWESLDVPLRTVVIYYAGVFENFYYPDGATKGTAAVGLGDERLHFNRNKDYNPAGDNGQAPNDPCPTGQSGIKYNYNGDVFVYDS
jgi:hypothetical protein